MSILCWSLIFWNRVKLEKKNIIGNFLFLIKMVKIWHFLSFRLFQKVTLISQGHPIVTLGNFFGNWKKKKLRCFTLPKPFELANDNCFVCFRISSIPIIIFVSERTLPTSSFELQVIDLLCHKKIEPHIKIFEGQKNNILTCQSRNGKWV